MTPTPITCRLDDIRIDGGTQPRTSINEATVSEYAEAIMSGDVFPPLLCVWDGVNRWLCDGFHRLHAHRQAGSVTVEVLQHSGTQRDAVLMSVGTNAQHGLRRSNDDKRRAVRMLLEDAEWGQWSDREIAKRCLVDHKTVAAVRAALSPGEVLTGEFPSEDSTRERKVNTKHGTQATMKTAGIAASNQQRAAAPEDAPAKARDEDDHYDAPDAGALLDEMQTDLRRAEARVAELEKALNDAGKGQVVTLTQRLDHAERRQAELMDEASRAKARADRYERTLARIGKAVGDKDLDQVAARVEAMVRKLRDAKVAA